MSADRQWTYLRGAPGRSLVMGICTKKKPKARRPASAARTFAACPEAAR